MYKTLENKLKQLEVNEKIECTFHELVIFLTRDGFERVLESAYKYFRHDGHAFEVEKLGEHDVTIKKLWY